MRSFILATLLLAAPAAAQDASDVPAQPASDVPAATGGERVNQLVIYGADPCPPSTEDVITVCARKPEGERYRIPEDLRDDPNDPKREAWANKATELQYVGRSGIGSCSTSGPGGGIGCYQELVRQARAERQGRDSVNWNRLIEQARQERLGRIDAESEAIEQELRNDE